MQKRFKRNHTCLSNHLAEIFSQGSFNAVAIMSIMKETKAVLDRVMEDDKSTQTTSNACNLFSRVPDFKRERNFALKLPTQRKSRYIETVRVPPPRVNADIPAEVTHINDMRVTREDLWYYHHEDDGMQTCKTCRFCWDGFAQHPCREDFL